MIDVSVVIPAYNAAETLAECLAAVKGQMFSRAREMEVILVDDGSADGTAKIAEEAGVLVIRQKNGGAAAARNAGLRAARGKWIAFTDADCVASRRWLEWLLRAAENGDRVMGAAGKTVGHGSETAAARFVDLSGGLDAAIHLAHPVFPFAPTANFLYRRDGLLEVGGFDARFSSFEGADLCHRLGRGTLRIAYEQRAVVLHHHRATWRAYWRQQRAYGRGYAELFLKYGDELPWSVTKEAGAWWRLMGMGAAMVAFAGDAGLCRRGRFVKSLAQRLGFVRTYWNAPERARWRAEIADIRMEAEGVDA